MRWDGVGWDGMREGVSTSSDESTCRMGWDEMRRDESEGRGEGGGEHGSASDSSQLESSVHVTVTRRVESSQVSAARRSHLESAHTSPSYGTASQVKSV
jgi:hypothetical protein